MDLCLKFGKRPSRWSKKKKHSGADFRKERGYQCAQDFAPGKCGGSQNYPSGADFWTEPVCRSTQDLVPGEVPRSPKMSFKRVFLNGVRLSKVPKISCQRSVEAVKSILQERSPEWRCEQSEVTEVTETLCQTRHESLSRFRERSRELRVFGVGHSWEEGPSFGCEHFSSHRRANTGLNHVVRVSNHMKKKKRADSSYSV